jgi:hypothetical protein
LETRAALAQAIRNGNIDLMPMGRKLLADLIDPNSADLIDPNSDHPLELVLKIRRERETRTALARAVRGGIDEMALACELLADLIDPNSDHPLELILKIRQAGHSTDVVRDFNVALLMATLEKNGSHDKRAIGKVEDGFGLKSSQIRAIWNKHKDRARLVTNEHNDEREALSELFLSPRPKSTL